MDIHLLKECLKAPTRFIAFEDVATEAIVIMAEEISKRKDCTRSFEQVLFDCLKGKAGEMAVMMILNESRHIWARPSLERDYDERKYDLEAIHLVDFIKRNNIFHPLEVKTIPKIGRYFEFNRYKGDGALSLRNFLAAPEVEYLISVQVVEVPNKGFHCLPTHVFHRDAFDVKYLWPSQGGFKCDTYVWYDDVIAEKLCVRI